MGKGPLFSLPKLKSEAALFITFILLFFMLTLSSNILYANLIKILPSIEWEQYFGGDYFYQNRSLAFSPDGKLLIIGGVYSSSEKGRRIKNVEGIWIWSIDHRGTKIGDIRLEDIDLENEKHEIVRLVDIDAMNSTNNENVVFVGKLNTGQSVFIKLDKQGNILTSKKIKQGRHISKIIRTSDNKFVLIGHERLDSLLVKIDDVGTELWSKVFDRNKSELLIDGIENNKGFLLIENSGKIEQFFMGDSHVWVTQYNSDGKKLYEKSFAGRYGSVARGENGNYVILYDKSDTSGQDIRVQAFNQNLNELWNVDITRTQFGLEQFKVVSLTGGNYVISGSVSGKPWVSYIDSSGKKRWDYHGNPMEFATGFDFGANHNSCFIVSTMIVVEGKKPSSKIRVVKFMP